MKFIRPLAVAVLLSAAITAQTLTINGASTSTNANVGTTVACVLTGTPGLPTIWGFSQDAGPTSVNVGAGPVSIPIGIGTSFFDIGLGAPFPATDWVFNVDVPSDEPGLIGTVWHSVGVELDPSALHGLRVSNGVAVHFVQYPASAGADGATLTSRPLTLDGSANATAPGVFPAGMTFSWAVTAAPAGSNPVISNADAPFPTFTSGTPGVYHVTLTVGGSVPFGQDTTQIEVYGIAFTSPVDGTFSTTGTTSVAGQVTGPTPAAFKINGVTRPLSPTGAFSIASVPPQGPGATSAITAEVTTPSGAKVSHTVCLLVGTGRAITSPAAPAVSLRANGVSFDPLEAPVATLLGTVDFGAAFAAVPPVPIISIASPFNPNFIIYSAAAQISTFTHDPTVLVDFFPGTNGAVGISITFTNVVVTGNITGKQANVPYTTPYTITATSAVVTGDIVFAPNAAGLLQASVTNGACVLNGFVFTAQGSLGTATQSTLIQNVLRTAVQTALAGSLQLLPPLINPLLTQYNSFTFDLTPSGVPLVVGFPANALHYDALGITVALGLTLTPGATSPESPTLTDYRHTPGAAPIFGATSPVLALPYTNAVAVNDDTLNLQFASFVTVGALNLDLTTAIGTGATATPLTAGALAALLPGDGFEVFDAATPVTVHVRHTTAPALTLAQTATSNAVFHVSDARVSFAIGVGAGETTVLTTCFSAELPVTLALNAATSTISVTPGTALTRVTVDAGFPGHDATPSSAALGTLLSGILPNLLAPLSSVPLPGAGGTAVEISLINDSLGMWF